jgi:bifunctional enzyme CysN/CysC
MSYEVKNKELIRSDIQTYLKRHEEKDMLRFLTAGSVDDGKSTLIGRLLYDSQLLYEDQLSSIIRDSKIYGHTDNDFDPALLTDGLKAEREQGITIDVAYRFFSTSKRSFIICDCPGHEQYTRNMATGASNCNLAIILVDARRGILPQTKRHSFVASLLGIKHFLVAINKMDAVDYSESIYEQIRKDYLGFAAKLDVNDVHFIPISALNGDNVVKRSEHMSWFMGSPVLSYLENVQIAVDTNLIDFRFPVQSVIRPDQNFRGFSGTISSGIIHKGDEICICPSGQTTRIKSIVTFDEELNTAFAPMAVTITTEDEVDISRGDIICKTNNRPHQRSEFDAQLVWMDSKPLIPGRNYLLKCGTIQTAASVEEIRYKFDINTLSREKTKMLEINSIGRVRIRTHRPISFDAYAHNRSTGGFILIDSFSNATAAAGMILEQVIEPPKINPVSKNIRREVSKVTIKERESLMGHLPATIWLTGLSGSGKSATSQLLEQELHKRHIKTFILDGDNVRHGLNKDLGFSPDDRQENIRRIAEVARLMNEAGLIVITAFISPYREDRDQARKIITKDNLGKFIETYIDTPLELCEQRDVKGLYTKARKGEIKGFTGIDAPYETPKTPELTLHTDNSSIQQNVTCILRYLETHNII